MLKLVYYNGFWLAIYKNKKYIAKNLVLIFQALEG
nr:MAG TPA: hypothetical protein [Caudoviricetes sp.]